LDLGGALRRLGRRSVGRGRFPAPAHLSNAIAKVAARNRIDAIRIARNAGWL
jgi:hypothetical protein